MASFFDRLRYLITNKSQQTNEQYNRAIYNYLGNSILWNPDNDNTYIDEGYRKNATVYSLINIITKAASTIPYHVYRKVNESKYKSYKALSSGIADSSVMYKANLLKSHALEELEHTELHKLMERPNPSQSYASFISELIAFGKLTGNRYVYGLGPDTGENVGKYTELYVMPSHVVEINTGGLMKPVDYYTIEYNGLYRIEAQDMLHIKDFNPHFDGTGSHLYGQSPLKAGMRSMTTNNEAVETGVKFLQNQTSRGILMSEEGDLNEVQAQQLKDKFRRQHQGSSHAGDVIITPKKLSWVNFGLSTSDLSLIEQYNASIKDLCNIYNVPVQLLNNTESSTYNNMKEAKKALYQNCVIPELQKIQDELNRWLAPKYGEDICIEYDFSVIPELQEETDKIVDQMSKAWWLTPNEKRSAMSYDHDTDTPSMNDYYFPANLLPIDNQDIDVPVVDINLDEPDMEKMLSKAKVPGMTDVFTTQEEAEARARELGGSGSHQHTYDGEPVYMPFKTHEEYMEAVENDKYHYGKPHDEDEEKQKVSATVEKGLKKKVEEHNEKVSKSWQKTNLRTLKAVFRRGVGAYNTNPSSVRPSVSSADQWAYARCNSFLYCLRNGRFRSGKHDTDLLPKGHPLSSKKEAKAEGYDDYPQSASNNAKRMIEWKEKYGDEVKGGTMVGWKRASMLASRTKLSRDVVSRMAQFNRHRKNATVDPKYKDTPWKDNGYVAWNLWGGTSGVNWAIRKMETIRNNE
ncbi:MAG: putative portal protein [Prokaryotic dsDNA virus sp.]|jgi:HK97 family phage portal protein|nr:MAG: putative portal protein [Prokaryotic dsDNA virus sp.]|tara:strand:- start:1897 stop:4131 length:2235 start_codon:yes stop_codon:yes gene_type:complete